MARRSQSPARAWWKIVYRQQRISRREIFKAASDAALFGVGYYEEGEAVPDFIRHVPALDIQCVNAV